MKRILFALRRRLAYGLVVGFLLSAGAFAQKAHQTDTAVPQDERAKFEAEVRKMINRSGEGLTVYKLDNGAKVANLHGRFQSVALAKKDAKGNVTTTCVSTRREATQFLKKSSKPTGPVSKKFPRKSAASAEVK